MPTIDTSTLNNKVEKTIITTFNLILFLLKK